MATSGGLVTRQELIDAQVDVTHLGNVANSTGPTSVSRKGVTHKTLSGLQDEYETAIAQFEANADVAIANAGYQDVGDYENDDPINSPNDYLVYQRATAPTQWKTVSGVALPYSPDSTTTPDPENDPNLELIQERNVVTSIAELKARSTSTDAAIYLSDAGRSGWFEWRTGDFTTEVVVDTPNGVYAPSDGDPTGATGCWVRRYEGAFLAQWFGLVSGSFVEQTAILQAFLSLVPDGARAYIKGAYVSDHLQFEDKTDVSLCGAGCYITWTGTKAVADKLGLELVGSVVGCEIYGFDFTCDGGLANGHSGVFSQSGVTLNYNDIHHNTVRTGVNGISLNTNLSGSQTGNAVYLNRILGTVGTGSGEGYGIHLADGSGDELNNRVYANYIELATRHSIYFAKGITGEVHSNIIYRHRYNQKTGQVRGAIQCLRSNNVDIHDNILIDPSDGGLVIARTALNGENCSARGNKFVVTSEAFSSVPLINVGSQGPSVIDPDAGAEEGSPSNVTVKDNVFDIDNNTVECIRLWSALGATVSGNTGRRVNTSATSTAITIRGEDGDTYNSNYNFTRNEILQDSGSEMFRYGPDVVGSSYSISVIGNEPGEATMFAGVSPDNPNITIKDQDVTGLSMASGVYANGRYQIKAEAVDVITTGELGVGEAFGFNYSMPNVKQGDPVSVCIPDIGSGNFLLSANANANNNVRLVVFNGSQTGLSLTDADLTVVAHVNR